jgi:hypothetical protein
MTAPHHPRKCPHVLAFFIVKIANYVTIYLTKRQGFHPAELVIRAHAPFGAPGRAAW